ncbi:baseplate J/gp47 family protein, partial [Pseudomonas aeruginosa]
VAAQAISLIGSSIPGVDTVSNAAAFSNGVNAEPDAALRARFILFINALSKSTDAAIGYAITSLGQGLRYQILDNQS